MKVIKFGGTSVGSANSILSVKENCRSSRRTGNLWWFPALGGHHRQADKHVENGGCR